MNAKTWAARCLVILAALFGAVTAAVAQPAPLTAAKLLADGNLFLAQNRPSAAQLAGRRALTLVERDAPRTLLHAEILKLQARSVLADPQNRARLETALAIQAEAGAAAAARLDTLQRLSLTYALGVDPEARAQQTRLAREAVRIAEESGDPKLLFDALSRLWMALGSANPEAAAVQKRLFSSATQGPPPPQPPPEIMAAAERLEDGLAAKRQVWPVLIAWNDQIAPPAERPRIYFDAAEDLWKAGDRTLAVDIYQQAVARVAAWFDTVRGDGLDEAERLDLSSLIMRLAEGYRRQADAPVSATTLDHLLTLAQAMSTSEAAAAVRAAKARGDRGATLTADLLSRRDRAEQAFILALDQGDLAAAARYRQDRTEAAGQLEPQGSPAVALDVVTRAQVQSVLRPREAAVIFLGDQVRDGLAVLVRRDRVVVRPITTRDAFESDLRGAYQIHAIFAYNALRTGRPQRLEPFNYAAAAKVYQVLFAPFAADLTDIDRLGVVVWPGLDGIALTTLVTKTTTDSEGELRAAEWLIDRHALTSLPSLSALVTLRGRPGPDPTAGVLAIGAPRLTPRTSIAASRFDYASILTLGSDEKSEDVCGLADVRSSAGMADQFLAHFGADRSRALLSEAATEATLRRLSDEGALTGYRAVAFATHGLPVTETPATAALEPALVLTPPWDCETATRPAFRDPADDGLLTQSEITHLRLSADWVFLIACDTADGRDEGAATYSGLASAFLAAGARSVMVSHWRAEEGATAALVERLFDEAAPASFTLAERLRRAQQKLRDDPRYADPAFWAVFSIVGDGE